MGSKTQYFFHVSIFRSTVSKQAALSTFGGHSFRLSSCVLFWNRYGSLVVYGMVAQFQKIIYWRKTILLLSYDRHLIGSEIVCVERFVFTSERVAVRAVCTFYRMAVDYFCLITLRMRWPDITPLANLLPAFVMVCTVCMYVCSVIFRLAGCAFQLGRPVHTSNAPRWLTISKSNKYSIARRNWWHETSGKNGRRR